MTTERTVIPHKKHRYIIEAQHNKLERELTGMAEFRFNVITRSPEVKFKVKGSRWISIDDYTLNSIIREIKRRGFKFSKRSVISEILASDFAPEINPIRAYFKSLSYQGKGIISALAQTVQLIPSEMIREDFFETYLKKWMVGAVANVFDSERCVNHLCLILAGPQGTYKSTWIRNLSPPALSQYYMEGSLDPDNKDSLLATTGTFIFNLDDYFAAINAKKINEFKGLITKNKVKVRRPFARYPEELPKICSFIASSNETHFLHDTTGNRRFLPFAIEAIDIDTAIKLPIDQAWAEAYHLFRGGHVYWLTHEDRKELARNIEQFEVQSNEYEVLTTYLRPPKAGEGPDAMLTNADILEYLHKKVSIRLSTRKLGQALVKAGFPKSQKRRNYRRSRVYAVVYTDEADIILGRQPIS